MKKQLITLSLIILSFCALAQTSRNSEITTIGKAHVYAPPDEVLIRFSYTTRSESLSEARTENDLKLKKAITFCKSLGIQKQHIQSDHVNLSTKRKRNSWKVEDIEYFQASQSISVCLRDLNKFDEFVSGLIENNVDQVSGITFRCTDLSNYKEQARKKAIQSARSKAKVLALELNQSIGLAVQITELQVNPGWAGQQAYANTITESSGTDSDNDQGFAPGQLKVEASIEVTFNLHSE